MMQILSLNLYKSLLKILKRIWKVFDLLKIFEKLLSIQKIFFLWATVFSKDTIEKTLEFLN